MATNIDIRVQSYGSFNLNTRPTGTANVRGAVSQTPELYAPVAPVSAIAGRRPESAKADQAANRSPTPASPLPGEPGQLLSVYI